MRLDLGERTAGLEQFVVRAFPGGARLLFRRFNPCQPGVGFPDRRFALARGSRGLFALACFARFSFLVLAALFRNLFRGASAQAGLLRLESMQGYRF